MTEDPSELMEGTEKLRALYGSWISFHDAVVESVLLERVGPTVTIRFITNDAVSTDGGQTADLANTRRASVVMRWHEVRDLVLSGVDWDENNWIDGLKFVRSRDTICTLIERMDGTHGFIQAERVEVVSAELLECSQ
ncbi:MAG: Imm50 family immunity protein [Armatimonadota bacterium]